MEKKRGRGSESSHKCDLRRRCRPLSLFDRLSALPEPILHHILSFLPYRSAVVTGVLSSHWRHLWEQRLPHPSSLHLVEDIKWFHRTSEFIADVNRQIELHPPPRRLDVLSISFRPYYSHFTQLRRWMKYSRECGVADFRLHLLPYPLKFVFYYSSPSLVRLTLTGVHITRSRRRYTDLTSLEAISLHRVSITNEAMKNLIASCPALRVLELCRCQDLNAIRLDLLCRITTLRVVLCRGISAIALSVPRLRCLYLRGVPLHSMTFVGSKLEEVYMSWNCWIYHPITELSPDSWNAPEAFTHVQFLTVGGIPFEHLALHTTLALENLRELQILIAEMSDGQFGIIYKFFENVRCPSLESLFIELPPTYSGCTMKLMSKLDETEHPPLEGISLKNVRIIKIKNFRAVSMETHLVKFFLKKAICLESMIIVVAEEATKVSTHQKCNRAGEPSVIRQQLELFPKASTNATLLFYEFGDERVQVQPRHYEAQNANCRCTSSR